MNDFKVLHTADLGLRNLPYGGINPESGLNRRFEDVLNNFKFVISQAIKEGVKYFVIAGDINEERNPESILVEKFSGFVADLISKDIKVIIVAGNHDVDSSKGTSTSISYLKELGLVNTYIADTKPDTFEFDDVVFHCIPTMYYSQLGMEDNDEFTEYLNKCVKDIKLFDGKKNIFVSHYALETTFAGLNVDEAVLYSNNLLKFDYVALGHIHKYEMSTEFTGGYSGSLFIKDFGEQKDKYVNIINFITGKLVRGKSRKADIIIDKISVPEREFIEYKLDCIGKDAEEILQFIKENVSNVKGKIIKLRLNVRKRINPKLIYEYLREQEVFHHTPIEWDIATDEKIKRIDVKSGMTDQDIVVEYLSNRSYDAKMKTEILNYTNRIIEKCESSVVL